MFESGHVYGIVGRNGSGKSVFLNILLGFMRQASGEIQFEKDGKEYHEKLWIGPIRLDNSTDCKPLDETKEYCYAELKEYKYFAESEEVLELLYECERYVLEKVGLK